MATLLPVPESEQRVLDNLIRDLNETYPDKIIVRLQQDHKKWYEKVTRLYKNIGYASRDEFLNKQVFEFNAKNDNELVERASRGQAKVEYNRTKEYLKLSDSKSEEL